MKWFAALCLFAAAAQAQVSNKLFTLLFDYPDDPVFSNVTFRAHGSTAAMSEGADR